MAHVKVQSMPNHTGHTLSTVMLSSSVIATNSAILRPSLNGSLPESAVDCNNTATGLTDSVPSDNLLDNTTNPKEKTPMCMVNELARFNRIHPLYKLLNEQGPAHAKMFTVQLTLGEQTWEAEGSSIKKAHHSAASKALNESTLPKPMPRPPKSNVSSNPGSITPTVELNGLAMRRGEPAIYTPLDPKPAPNYRTNYNFRGMYNQRYHCPVPKIFYVQLTVGEREFFGEGKTCQAARHNAAMKALQVLQNEPIPPKLTQNKESGNEIEEEKDANKSETSIVFEIALKRNMPVSFEVVKESGPPHMKSFVTRVTVGAFAAEGEGNSKKLSKKRAAIAILQELGKLPPLPVVEKPKLHFKKHPRTALKTGPGYGQGMNPISRLAQIQQAKREKEPEYLLLSERGAPRCREFIIQVRVGNEVTTGTGPNKKIAKRNAAERMLLHLGYKASSPLQDQTEMSEEVMGWSGQNVGYPESSNNTPKGILHLSPDVYQEMESSCNKASLGTPRNSLPPKEMSQTSSSFFSMSPATNSTATIARELHVNGTSPTVEAIGLKEMPLTSPYSTVQPSKQLEYLARLQGFQVHYSDRENGKECMTCLTLSPVQMAFHGIGSSIEDCHDQAALSALKQFSEQGLDNVEGTVKVENGSFEKHLAGHQFWELDEFIEDRDVLDICHSGCTLIPGERPLNTTCYKAGEEDRKPGSKEEGAKPGQGSPRRDPSVFEISHLG